jgi:hypothetical protein
MSLYSHNGEYPRPLPNRIVLSNGQTRTDKTTFTAEEIADAGWVAVSDRPTAAYPNKVYWNGSSWVVRPPNQGETDQRWLEVRRARDTMLVSSDIIILRALEQGNTPDPAWVTYRQELRDLPQNTADPFYVTWPTSPGE